MDSAYAQWTSSYHTGLELIDLQNNQLYQCFEELLRLLAQADQQQQPLSIDPVRALLTRLGNYAQTQHVLEEMLLEQAAYPKLAQHRAEHIAFKAKLSQFDRALTQGHSPQAVARSLHAELNHWMQSHLATHDQACIPYLKQVSGLTWLKRLWLWTKAAV